MCEIPRGCDIHSLLQTMYVKRELYAKGVNKRGHFTVIIKLIYENLIFIYACI